MPHGLGEGEEHELRPPLPEEVPPSGLEVETPRQSDRFLLPRRHDEHLVAPHREGEAGRHREGCDREDRRQIEGQEDPRDRVCLRHDPVGDDSGGHQDRLLPDDRILVPEQGPEEDGERRGHVDRREQGQARGRPDIFHDDADAAVVAPDRVDLQGDADRDDQQRHLEEQVHHAAPHQRETEEVLADEGGREADGEHVAEVEQAGVRQGTGVRPVVVQGRGAEQVREGPREDEEDHRDDEGVPGPPVRDLADDVGGDGERDRAAGDRDRGVPLGGFDHGGDKPTRPRD